MGVGVDHELPEHPSRDALLVGTRTSQHGADPRDEDLGAERFGEVVVGSDRQADQGVDLLRASSEHHDVGVGERAQLSAHLDAVDVGEREIEEPSGG